VSELPWFVMPVLALLLGVLALGPLGAQVLRRGVVFIDLAVAQAAAAAALWAGAALDHPGVWVTQALAALGAGVCAAVVALLARCAAAQREALIGLLYVLGASLALLGARQDVHGREHLAELLAADVLWAGPPQVAAMAACAVLVALAARATQRDVVFYAVFALVASVAVPVLGLFVVFAALIAPALWMAAGTGRVAACAGAALAAALGLAGSWLADWPSGACVAVTLVLFGLASLARASSDRTELELPQVPTTPPSSFQITTVAERGRPPAASGH
jgi:zinc/manganese transport system permease protein